MTTTGPLHALVSRRHLAGIRPNPPPFKDDAMSSAYDRSTMPRRAFLRRLLGVAGGASVAAVAAACSANSSTSSAATAAGPTTASAGAMVAPTTAKPATPASASASTAATAAPALQAPASGGTFDAAQELAIAFSYVADTTGGGGGGRVNNPYVAVWIEDTVGAPVRSISLNYQIGRGDKWLPDLQRWFRTAKASAAVETISSATKVAGAYKVVWDGQSDKKAAVAYGDYFVCIEAARERGPYEIVREQITIGAAPFTKPLAAKGELRDVTVELRARS